MELPLLLSQLEVSTVCSFHLQAEQPIVWGTRYFIIIQMRTESKVFL